MDGKYFKPRSSFTMKVHRYDLGTIAESRKLHRDRFFLKKLIKIPEKSLLDLYDYHSEYYQKKADKPEEAKREFFIECVKLLKIELELEEKKDNYKMSSKQRKLNELRKSRYSKLISLLKNERDAWGVFHNKEKKLDNIDESLQDMIDQTEYLEKENQRLNEELKMKNKQIRKLRVQLKDIRVFNNKKINIREEDFGTLINIFKNLKDLSDPVKMDDARFKEKFFQTKSKNTWIKLISNNFSINRKKLKYSRVENYFVERDRNLPKGTRRVRIQLDKEELS